MKYPEPGIFCHWNRKRNELIQMRLNNCAKWVQSQFELQPSLGIMFFW